MTLATGPETLTHSPRGGRDGNGARPKPAESPAVTTLTRLEREMGVHLASEAAERRLHIDTPPESPGKRMVFLLLALSLCVVHLGFSQSFWAPAHYGNNQSAYLVAGKYLVTRGTSGFEPQSPFDFVGWMWNMADETSTAAGGGWVYPKYPLGLPLLYGIVYRAGLAVGGMDTAVAWTFLVPPVCTTLAMLAIFFTTRLLAGSFPAVLAMIGFATLTVVVVLTNNAYSHAADMAFVAWGIFALLKWWQHGGIWRGILAGFLLGYSATIRYTEGLLVLPIVAAILCSMRWHRPRGWIIAGILSLGLLATAAWASGHVTDATISADDEITAGEQSAFQYHGSRILMWSAGIGAIAPAVVMLILMIRVGHGRMLARLATPLLAWAAPLSLLVTYNLLTFGSPTGYDSTNESTGFTLAEMQKKWRWGIDQFYNTGLYFFLPFTFVGLLMAFRWNWRVALVLLLWYVPGTALYLSYYWGMNLPVWGFLRFFASTFPAGIVAAMWLLQRAATGQVSMQAKPASLSEDDRATALLATGVCGVVGMLTLISVNLSLGESAFKLSWPVGFAAMAAGLLAGAIVIEPMGNLRRAGTALAVLAAVGVAGGLAWWQMDRGWAGVQFPGYVAMIAVAAAIVTAGVFGAGRGVAPAIAMGLIVGFPAAINLDVSDSPLERDHTIAQNLSHAGRQIRSFAPDGSLVFADSQLVCNYLQFAGNYRLMGSDYFRGGRPVPAIGGGATGENPNPIQPERKRFVEKVYSKYDRRARMAEATRVAKETLREGRRAFVVVEVATAGSLADELAKDSELISEQVAAWVDPARMSSSAMSSLGTIGRDGFARREPWRWRIYEVKLARSPKPSTAPATGPSSQPAD